jgi:hypothetical protein
LNLTYPPIDDSFHFLNFPDLVKDIIHRRVLGMKKIVGIFGIAFISLLLLNRSQVQAQDTTDQVRGFTHSLEFDYVSWTIESLTGKMQQFTSGITRYLEPSRQHDLVKEYADTIRELDDTSAEIRKIYADPAVKDPKSEASNLLKMQAELQKKRTRLAPLAEGILQSQISAIVDGQNLVFLGQPLPAVLFNVTPLPMALIVSPRDKIQQDANISLFPDLPLDKINTLEEEVSQNLDVSALVVPVGGIGMYPTMVMSSSDLNWLIETISHEWIHNYLTLRPLGMNYETSPELRTMNETTASIAGKEIAEMVIAKYYPELVPPPPPKTSPDSPPKTAEDYLPRFNFNREMHTTRVTVDGLLARGMIDRAEQFMESQREYFLKNGYQIRKLNQAYFAFYGAYADQPGGAAGEDPVGPAVRALRERSQGLAEFLKRISGMTNFEQLTQAVK